MIDVCTAHFRHTRRVGPLLFYLSTLCRFAQRLLRSWPNLSSSARPLTHIAGLRRRAAWQQRWPSKDGLQHGTSTGGIVDRNASCCVNGWLRRGYATDANNERVLWQTDNRDKVGPKGFQLVRRRQRDRNLVGSHWATPSILYDASIKNSNFATPGGLHNSSRPYQVWKTRRFGRGPGMASPDTNSVTGPS